MAELVVVAGTGTEVGKTWVGARLLEEARRSGMRVSARKPVQSFAPGSGPTDAEVLAAASGEDPEDVCPPHRSYGVPMAPFMAAERVGAPPFTLDDLVAELRWPPDAELRLVEPAGGVRSPMTADGADTVDLVARLQPDEVVLVADAGLGTINVVRLCLDALTGYPVTVLLNRYQRDDDLHRANRAWLDARCGAPVVTEPSSLLHR